MTPYKIGSQVFDGASQSFVKILDLKTDDVATYILTDAPNNPTNDGAFPDGWRNDFEISDKPFDFDY